MNNSYINNTDNTGISQYLKISIFQKENYINLYNLRRKKIFNEFQHPFRVLSKKRNNPQPTMKS